MSFRVMVIHMNHIQGSVWVKILAVVVVLLVIGGAYMWYTNQGEEIIGGQTDVQGCLVGAGYSWCEARQQCERGWERYCTTAQLKTALFTCDEGKSISATFYPDDDKYVDLVLSDQRAMSVPRAISASGARYAKEDESFVFWNKGDTAFVTENDTTTFSGCVMEGE